MKTKQSFEVEGTLKRPGKRKPETVSFFIDAIDREDALWQAHHDVIEAAVNRDFPGSKMTYDLRKLRKQSGPE